MNLGNLKRNINAINSSPQYKHRGRLGLQNSTLKRVVNLYQLKYANSVAQGFGDYLRGCFCLLQMAMKHNLRFDINFANHPISQFLEIPEEQKEEKINYNQVYRYMKDNLEKDHASFYNEFCRHLNMVYLPNYYLFCNSYPFARVNRLQRTIISSKFKPNNEMRDAIEHALTDLQFREPYYTIHIRTGDKFILQNNKMTDEIAAKIYFQIREFIIPQRNYLLLSDNNELKAYLIKRFSNFRALFKEITHLGESKDPSANSVKNTLLDFFLMSKSKSVLSFSVYPHGTSFSEWCSELYNIPYHCIQLDVAKRSWMFE